MDQTHNYLNADEEEELVRFLLRCAAIGYPKSRHEVLALVTRMLERKGISGSVTSGWWLYFCHRHPNLTLRTPAPLSKARHDASNPETVVRYFDLLEQTMVENDLLDKPGQIYNVDESGMPFSPRPVKYIFRRGVKDPVAPSSGDKSQITIVGCVSASGYCIPPMVILDRKKLPPQFTVGEVPGTIWYFVQWLD